MSNETSFKVRLTQEENYQFRVTFDSPTMDSILVDEPAPLGKNEGPNAARLVAAAVANCLSASLLFAVRKFKQEPGMLAAEAVTRIARNEQGRIRIAGIDVAIQLGGLAGNIEHLERSLAQFEDFCLVTQSIRQGIPVHVEVKDAAGLVVYPA